MQFCKMQALGNDFVIFGSPSQTNCPDKKIISHICNRHYGVGGDCAIFIGESKDADFAMHVYNPDGFEAEICGNALRCSAKYVTDNGFFRKRTLTIETQSGIRTAKVENDIITAEIGKPTLLKQGNLEIAGKVFPYFFISIGNPHCVIFVKAITDDEFMFYGAAIEKHPVFPNRTNVEFASVLNENEIAMRVWERGIGETLSCSTGSCACVAAANALRICSSNVKVHQTGGTIEVQTRECGNMFISGVCKTVFKGYLL